MRAVEREYAVTFLPDQKTVRVPEGTLLLEAERLAEVETDALCGGHGICGKCKRMIQTGSGKQEVLACCFPVREDLQVWLPEREKRTRILTEGVRREVRPDSGISVVPLNVLPICAGEPDSIQERVQQAAERETGIPAEEIRIVPRLAGSMYRVLQETNGSCFGILYQNGRQTELLELCSEKPEPYLLAVDIGTTTLAGYLMKADSGKICAKVSRVNPQTVFGADVITRADYGLEHGIQELTQAIREAVRELAGDAAKAAGIVPRQIFLAAIAGNTCMHHLFLGISPEALVKAPYSPVVRESMELEEQEISIGIHPQGKIRMLPNLAGFVGADTSACLLAAEFDRREQVTLLLDIGTNGEMVLGTRERAFACSTAAGPAFEGAKISCGMRGAAGAIDHVWLEDGNIRYSVIGKEKPTGICGSGLLDAAAVFLECGILDSSGVFAGETKGQKKAYLYRGANEDESICLTQKDISELQLAKAAIAAGIRILCEKLQIRPEEIEKVLIAGAFGSYMNPASACRIGLLPGVRPERIEAVGNAAGEGARLAAVSRSEWKRCCRMAKKIGFVELAAEDEFSDLFVEELEFPEPFA